jgi:hypothetical protein
VGDAQYGEGRQFNLHSAGTDLVEGSALAVKSASGAITVDGISSSGVVALATGIGPGFLRTNNGTITASAQTVAIDSSGAATVVLWISGTWVADLEFEGTVDGANWKYVYAHGLDNASRLQITSSALVGDDRWVIPCSGYKQIRVRASAYTSGTASVYLTAAASTYGLVDGYGQFAEFVAVGDGTSNPQATLQTTSFGMVYSGVSWSRLRGDTDGLWVHGNVDHDAVDTGNPIKTGGKASSTNPTAVASGDRVDAYFGLLGEQMVGVGPGFIKSVSSAAIGSLNATYEVDCAGAAAVGFFATASTLVGTVLAEQSTDGSSWKYASFFTAGSEHDHTMTGVAIAPDTNSTWWVSAAGVKKVRLRINAYTSGSVTYIANITALHPNYLPFQVTGDHAEGETEDYNRSFKIGGRVHDIASLSSIALNARADAVFDTNGLLGVFGARYVSASDGWTNNAAGQLRVGDAESAYLGVLNFGYNGSSWDRFRTTPGFTGGQAVGGSTAADAALAIAPITVGGRASNAIPTAMSADGDVVDARFTRTGALNVYMVDQSGNAASIGGTQYLEDAALGAVGSGTGTLSLGRGSSAIPTSTSADGDATALWLMKFGALNVVMRQQDGAWWGRAEDDPLGAVGQGSGLMSLGRASASAPTSVSADNDVASLWLSRFGALNTVPRDTAGAAITTTAAALADATSNPTVGSSGVFLHGYNGTTWDRVRTANTGRLQVDVVTGGGGGTQYVGDAAATATPTGTVAMGLANAAAPTDVSANNDAVAAWYLRNGSQVVNLASGGTLITLGSKTSANSFPVVIASDQGSLTVTDSKLPTAAASADAFANPTITQIGVENMLFNGTTWDRVRSANGDAQAVTGLAAAALMGFNGTTWDRVRTANTGRLQVDVITGGGGGTQYVEDAGLGAVGSATGTLALGRASAAAPTAVSADADAVAQWMSRAGVAATMLASSTGTLVGTTTETGVSAITVIGIGGGTPHDSIDSGNPVKIGGVARTTLPANVAAGDRVNAMYSVAGGAYVHLGRNSPGSDGIANSSLVWADDITVGGGLLAVAPTIFNGTTWDRPRTIQGVASGASTDVGITASGIGPGYSRIPAAVAATGVTTATVSTLGAKQAVFRVTGTYTGFAATVQVTYDGTNYVTVGSNQAYIDGLGVSGVGTAITATAATGTVFVETWGAQAARLNVTAVSTGTANITMTANAFASIPDSKLPTAAASADALSNPTVTQIGVENMGFNGTTWDRLRTTDALDAVPNTTTGILAVGAGPGFDRKQNPANLGTAANSAITVVVDGADSITFDIGTGTTGTITFEYTTDDTNWTTHSSALKLGSIDLWWDGVAFAPVAQTRYMLRTTGLRQVRVRTVTTLGATVAIKWTASLGVGLLKALDNDAPPHAIGYTIASATAQTTTTQTSTILGPTNASTVRMAVTSIQIQTGGTTAGALQVYFGTGAYSRGTNKAIFDGEFAPSSTLKPGFALSPSVPWLGAGDEEVRFTTSAAINPLTITVWYYLISA